ncbi:MAG: YraN family protein [Bacteroidetes bacterium]|nr:YraN family protein [Bacteroidota bacterium]
MTEKSITGKKGEEAAVEYLIKKGYQIISTNKRFGKAEIDIIAKKDTEIVFVEVKTRTSDFFGFPEEFVTDKKIEMMSKAAEQFIEQNSSFTEIRFDIISVIFKNDKYQITHIEDAFTP